ncbi:MAG: RES domain-containing protein [Actinobacteria bacterium]|nr:RES domain-containing protein [Actinomycetota bacterium]
MRLGWPSQQAGSLARFPAEPTRSRTVYRVWRYRLSDATIRDSPWWFASLPDEPDEGGRYDLPEPMGACYTATRPVGAVLEALQALLTNLPTQELRVRRLATIATPPDAPAAAKLTAQVAAGRYGVTAALWAGTDRSRSQAWAAAFRRDGWWALYGGIQHDPSGQLRGHTLFDHQSEHPPTFGQSWPHTASTLHDDTQLLEDLIRFGIHVREPGDLPFTTRPSDIDDPAT